MLRLLPWFLIALYLVLAFQHYCNNRPLWLDEQCVFNNIKQLSFPLIFQQPLVDSQQFPRFYLFLIQQLSAVFNYHQLALRLLPLLAMIGAFSIWLLIARREIHSNLDRCLFIVMWLASTPLIYYAAELKQYSADVLACAVVVFFLLHQSKHLLLLAIVPLLGLFSYPVFILFPLIIWNLIVTVKQSTLRTLLPLGVFCLSLIIVVLIVYLIDLRYSNALNLTHYWRDCMISFESPGEFFKTLGEGFNNLISRWFAEKPKWMRMAARPLLGLGLIYLITNCWKFFKRDGFKFCSLTPIAAGILSGHLLLGMLHQYPFVVPRTSLFFAPILMMVTIKAKEAIYRRWPMLGNVMLVMMGMYLCSVTLGIFREVFIHGDLGAQTVLWQK